MVWFTKNGWFSCWFPFKTTNKRIPPTKKNNNRRTRPNANITSSPPSQNLSFLPRLRKCQGAGAQLIVTLPGTVRAQQNVAPVPDAHGARRTARGWHVGGSSFGWTDPKWRNGGSSCGIFVPKQSEKRGASRKDTSQTSNFLFEHQMFMVGTVPHKRALNGASLGVAYLQTSPGRKEPHCQKRLTCSNHQGTSRNTDQMSGSLRQGTHLHAESYCCLLMKPRRKGENSVHGKGKRKPTGVTGFPQINSCISKMGSFEIAT